MVREGQEAQPPKSSIRKLESPEKLQTLLKQDTYDDCLSCKLTGASAFIGLGAYSYFSGKHQLQRHEAVILKSGSRFGTKSRHAGITAIALSFVGMGFWRLVN